MRPAWPAYWLPLLGGLLPLLGTVVALHLSQQLSLIPVCNPFTDGCVSISRAARHDLPNYLFRALLLPAASLQALTWFVVAASLCERGATGRLLRALPWVGLVGATFLVLYGTFLGTEGDAYRWMRRYGVIFYFGCTCIAMVISAGLSHRHLAHDTRLRSAARALLALAFALPAMGIISATSPLFLPADTVDALENILEWWAALIFTLFFFALAWAWARADLRLTLLSDARS
jgi:hypothetical protein